jgi:Flp pilus assembly protein TadB
MEHLFDSLQRTEDGVLLTLADVELRLERYRRRHRLVAATALAGLVCWLYSRLGTAILACAPLMFGLVACSTLGVVLWEGRLRAERRRVVARLPEALQLRVGYEETTTAI